MEPRSRYALWTSFALSLLSLVRVAPPYDVYVLEDEARPFPLQEAPFQDFSLSLVQVRLLMRFHASMKELCNDRHHLHVFIHVMEIWVITPVRRERRKVEA